MPPQMLQIVKTPFSKPTIIEENLKCVLNKVNRLEEENGFEKNTIPIRIISIVGQFRTGKSFLIATLKELLKNPNFLENPENVIGGEDPDVPFKSGHQRHTTGINLFDEPFLIEDVDGQKMIVLLVDTQGAFDTRSDVNVSVKIISISNQIASTQIFNIKDYITGQDLDSLQLFVRFSTLQDEKMGQKLVFLIRDFVTDPEKYGRNMEYLSEVISETNNSRELSSAVEDISKAYEVVDCWTLPQPSPTLIRASNQVTVAELGDDFKLHLQEFLKSEIANHVPKKISGTPLTADGVENLIKNVVKFSNNGSIQEMRSAVQILIERSYQEAERKGIETLFELQRETRMFLEPLDPCGFDNFRQIAFPQSLDAYDSVTCFGNTTEKLEKKELFVERLEVHLQTMENENENRYFYGLTRDLLDKLKSEYRQIMRVSGLHRRTSNFKERHKEALDTMIKEFDKETMQLTEVSRLKGSVTAKRKQLETAIKGIYRELNEDNDYLIVQEKCKAALTSAQEVYRSRINEMFELRPRAVHLIRLCQQAKIASEDRFLEEMAPVRRYIPEMSPIVDEMLETEFHPIIMDEEMKTCDRIRDFLAQKDIESEFNRKLRELQEKIDQQQQAASSCTVM